MTITRGDFSNFQHKDKDKIEIAYGLWWPAAISKSGRHTQYTIDDMVGHEKIKGGAFLWGEYAIAVDFERYQILEWEYYFQKTLTEILDVMESWKFIGEAR